MSIDNPEIVGFDLGHGESALAHTRLMATGEPKPLEVNGASTIITMVGRTSDDIILIGREVIESESDNKVVESHLRFKHPDLDSHHYAGRATRLFVQGVVERLRGSKQFADLDEVLFFVGRPSDWRAVKDEYEALLKEAGFKNVVVIPESRAAFMNARETKELAANELAMRVLLIDIGSSTTDFTWSENLNDRPLDDFGMNELGAGLFDKHIFERSLATQENPDTIEKLFNEFPGKRAQADLKCREAKEKYFTSPIAGKGAKVQDGVSLKKGVHFDIEIDDKLMALLISEPLPELGNKSWITTFCNYLEECRKKMVGEPDFVYATGGAARMSFIPDVVKQVFPNAKYKMDKNPELAIASGLASFGQAFLKSQRFHTDVDELVKRGAVLALIREKVLLLYEQLANTLGKFITYNIVCPSLINWRNGDIATLLEAEARAKNCSAAWMGSAESKAMAAEVVKEWFKDVRGNVHMLSDPICTKYGLDTSALDLDPNMRFTTQAPGRDALTGGMLDDLDTIAALLSLIVATVTGVLLGGGGAALMHLPFIGQIIAGAIAFIGFAIGWDKVKQKAEDVVKDKRFPVWLRKKTVSVEKINDELSKASRDIAIELKNKMMEADKVAKKGQSLPEKIAAEMEAGLRQRADDQILRF